MFGFEPPIIWILSIGMLIEFILFIILAFIITFYYYLFFSRYICQLSVVKEHGAEMKEAEEANNLMKNAGKNIS